MGISVCVQRKFEIDVTLIEADHCWTTSIKLCSFSKWISSIEIEIQSQSSRDHRPTLRTVV